MEIDFLESVEADYIPQGWIDVVAFVDGFSKPKNPKKPPVSYKFTMARGTVPTGTILFSAELIEKLGWQNGVDVRILADKDGRQFFIRPATNNEVDNPDINVASVSINAAGEGKLKLKTPGGNGYLRNEDVEGGEFAAQHGRLTFSLKAPLIERWDKEED